MPPICLLGIWQCKSIAVCIGFDWYFVHVILSLFHVQISALHGISILIPHSNIPKPLCIPSPLWSEFSTLWPVESDLLWTVICTFCSLLCTMLWTWCSQLCWNGSIKAEIWRQIRFDRATRGIHNSTLQKATTGHWCPAKILVWQGFVRYEDRLNNRILHVIRVLETYIGMWYKSVSFGEIFVHPHVGIYRDLGKYILLNI